MQVSSSPTRSRSCLISAALVCLSLLSTSAARAQQPPEAAPPTSAPDILKDNPTSRSSASTDIIGQLDASIESLVRRVTPSVVQVLVTGYGPLDEDQPGGDTGLVIGRQQSLGSGVIVEANGYIVTNAHVVSGAEHVRVIVPATDSEDSPLHVLTSRVRSYEAHIVGISSDMDLAVLKIEATGLQPLPIAQYRDLRQGQMVFAFGNPEGLRNSVSIGVVSSVAREADPDNPMVFIQTDAAINPGNSGGALVNSLGELVGINTFILTQSGGNEGIGFAIPSSVVKFIYPQLIKYGHAQRGEIGIGVQSITPSLASGLGLKQDFGVIVADVLPGTPAEAAGVKIGDIVVSADGLPINTLPLFGMMLATRLPGTTIDVKLLRGDQMLALKIPVVPHSGNADQLTDLADPAKNLVPKLGILAITVNNDTVKALPDLRIPSGVVVAARAADQGASDNPLSTGDVIHSLNGKAVKSLEQLRTDLDAIKPGSAVVLQVERDGGLTFATFTLD
jgi:serine protease Do